jgi:nicotinamide phosphoribosyltransferase
MSNISILLNTDSYKASHYLQYPEGTTHVFSYIESRGGEYDKTLFFGLQAFIREYLTKPIKYEDITEAREVFQLHGLPFNEEGWNKVFFKHRGFLPIRIKAVREGTMVPVKNVLVTVENTDPELPWVTSYIETALLRAVWYPTTVATISHSIKSVIKTRLQQTADNIDGLPFKLHDFGTRGVSSLESAGIGGTAHLVNFMGTDNVPALMFARKYYGEHMAGFSIPAAEHSTITSWGRNGEIHAYENMLKQFAKPGALVAVVSDSYDLYNAVENIWGEALRQRVIDSGATVVIRPDSGNPADVVARVAVLLDTKFGSTKNKKGFKVLNNVRIIQGDGINEQSIKDILARLAIAGFSADNVAFGMGGALLQHMNRDTQQFAMKASAIKINGEWRDVFKQPATDFAKASKKGRLMLYQDNLGKFYTALEGGDGDHAQEMLHVVYDSGGNPSGDLTSPQTLAEIREIANKA